MRRVQLTNRLHRSSGPECSTADDMQKHLASEMTELFRLAFLLTASVEDAERCLILAMRECLAAECVFKQWLPVWVRRIVVRTGIEIVTGDHNESLHSAQPDEADDSVPDPTEIAILLKDSAGVFTLNDYERLVYVLTMVEQYPLRECAILLGRSTKEVRDARTSAVEMIATFESGLHRIGDTASVSPWTTPAEAGVDFDYSCGTVLE